MLCEVSEVETNTGLSTMKPAFASQSLASDVCDVFSLPT